MSNKKTKCVSRFEDEDCKVHKPITDPIRGEVYCGNCGKVFSEKMENSFHEDRFVQEGKWYSEARTGPSLSLTMHDKGLYTVIGGDKDSTGHSISGKNREIFYRLRSWDKRSKSESKIRNLGAAFTLLNGLKTKLAIPDNVVENAAYTYRKAQAKGLIKGRSIAPLLLASLYVACRETQTPRTMDDIAKAGNVKKSAISRSLRLLVRSLNLSLAQYDISSFITRLANNLNCSEKIKREAVEILEKAKKIGIVEGKNPVAIATATLYISNLQNGKSLSQGTFSKISGISGVTIRNICYLIKNKLRLQI